MFTALSLSLCLLLPSGSIRYTLMPPPVQGETMSVSSWLGITLPQPSSLSPSLSSPSSTPWQPSLYTALYWRSTVKTTRGPRLWVFVSIMCHSHPELQYVQYRDTLFLLLLLVKVLLTMTGMLMALLCWPAGLCCDGGVHLHVAGVVMRLGKGSVRCENSHRPRQGHYSHRSLWRAGEPLPWGLRPQGVWPQHLCGTSRVILYLNYRSSSVSYFVLNSVDMKQ